MSKKTVFEYFEFDITEAAYAALRGTGPFILSSLDGEAVGLLDVIPNLETMKYSDNHYNQTQEWVDVYKGKALGSYTLVSAKACKQSEFDTYRHLKALPVMRYAFDLPKPEAALITMGLVRCSTS